MFSKNLKYYRLMNSLTKKDLAEKINVTPMAISNYENGKRSPDIDTLRKMAKALKISVSDFLETRNQNLVFSHNEFRKNSGLTKEKEEFIRESVEEYFCRFMDSVEILGEKVLPDFPKIHTLSLTYNEEEDAKNLRKYLGFAIDGPIEDLIGKLENKGFLIYKININEHNFSGINGLVNDRPYIMINSTMTTERNRSTLAHELVHIMFNWEESKLNDQEIENYATKVGGAFLFPSSDAKRELGLKRNAISKDMLLVAKEYGISMMLLAKRAEIANIVNQSIAKRFYFLASQKGWRTNEPTRINPENPQLFEQLVYRAINENEINLQRGAELLKVPFSQVVNNCCFNNEE